MLSSSYSTTSVVAMLLSVTSWLPAAAQSSVSYFWGSCGTTFSMTANQHYMPFSIGNCEDEFSFQHFENRNFGEVQTFYLTDAMQRTWEAFKEKIISGTVFYSITPLPADTTATDNIYQQAIALELLDSSFVQTPFRAGFYYLPAPVNLLTDLQAATPYELTIHFAAELDKDSSFLNTDLVIKQMNTQGTAFKSYFTTPAALPAHIATFEVNALNYSAQIWWQTYPTLQGSRIALQRSYNNWHWHTLLDTIAIAQTPFSFIDHYLEEGNNFYRLAIQFPDGSVGYTFPKKLNLRKKWDFQIFPNPCTLDELTLFFEKEFVTPFSIEVYNQWGMTVHHLSGAHLPNYFQVGVRDLPTGFYAIKVADLQGNTIGRAKFVRLAD